MSKISRRNFLKGIGAATAAGAVVAITGVPALADFIPPEKDEWNVLEAMEAAWNECWQKGQSAPDLIYVSKDVYEAYQDCLTAQQRFTWTDSGDIPNVVYRHRPVYLIEDYGYRYINMVSGWSLDDMVNATMKNRERQIAENIQNHNALLAMLEKHK